MGLAGGVVWGSVVELWARGGPEERWVLGAFGGASRDASAPRPWEPRPPAGRAGR